MATELQTLRSKIYGMADAASKDWFGRQLRNPYASMYFYYKPNQIAFYIGEEPLNDQWELAHPERVSPAKSQNQVCQWMCQIAERLPVLPLSK